MTRDRWLLRAAAMVVCLALGGPAWAAPLKPGDPATLKVLAKVKAVARQGRARFEQEQAKLQADNAKARDEPIGRPLGSNFAL